MLLQCAVCDRQYSLDDPRWRCDCGGYLRLLGTSAPQPSSLAARPVNLWRYSEALPDMGAPAVSLGEVLTPLTPVRYGGREYLLKLDYLMPTGSYKDRGVAVMVNNLVKWGVSSIVEDSSGNAGASVAAYSARAGIAADIYVPAYTSEGKIAQISLFGANLVKVPGTREDTTAAALSAGEKTFYASHNWSPFFEHGVKTYVYEIWEQMAFRMPDVIIAPCGNGSLITSAYAALTELREAGYISKIPRLVAVQSESCAPLATAWSRGLDNAVPIHKGETIAEGIASARPIKGREILRAVRETGGCFVTVSDHDVWGAMQGIARTGVFMEPTSATAPAAAAVLAQQGFIRPSDQVVIEVTGSGLKATDKLLKLSRA